MAITMKKKPIVIIGGMGPEASAYLYSLLIKQSIDEFKAVNNEDFPEILLYSIPVPDFISNNKNRQKALRMLKERTIELNKINPLCIAIACNTAHSLLSGLQAVSEAPFASMIDGVVNSVKKERFTTLGLLGTPSTIRSGLYQNALAKINANVIIPTNKQIAELDMIIRNIIAGKNKREDVILLKNISDSLIKKGAESILLGCTELPLLFPKKYKVRVYSSLEILSLNLLIKYYS